MAVSRRIGALVVLWKKYFPAIPIHVGGGFGRHCLSEFGPFNAFPAIIKWGLGNTISRVQLEALNHCCRSKSGWIVDLGHRPICFGQKRRKLGRAGARRVDARIDKHE